MNKEMPEVDEYWQYGKEDAYRIVEIYQGEHNRWMAKLEHCKEKYEVQDYNWESFKSRHWRKVDKPEQDETTILKKYVGGTFEASNGVRHRFTNVAQVYGQTRIFVSVVGQDENKLSVPLSELERCKREGIWTNFQFPEGRNQYVPEWPPFEVGQKFLWKINSEDLKECPIYEIVSITEAGITSLKMIKAPSGLSEDKKLRRGGFEFTFEYTDWNKDREFWIEVTGDTIVREDEVGSTKAPEDNVIVI